MTIGVYGFDLDEFLATLEKAGVTIVLDVRQRRGVRGTQYAWANSKRLQRALAEARVGYARLPELAPTTELREAQYREDARPRRAQTFAHGVGGRVRPWVRKGDPQRG